MKALSSKNSKGISTGTYVNCADNTGAKIIKIIAVLGYKGVSRRQPKAGVGDMVMAAVKKGNEKIRHEVVRAVIIRQRKEYRRADGMRIKFEDNAAVLLKDNNDPRGNLTKGPMAKEVTERFLTVGKIASSVV